MKRVGVLIFTGWALLAAPALAQSGTPPAGDVAKGKTLYTQVCSACHQAKTSPVAPTLSGVFGRKAGTAPGFKYSKGMVDSGITWDGAQLETYLAAPTKLIKGGIMAINVPKATDRADVIAYLKTLK